MNILHLASFTGNIGDEANHNGFRRKFQENIDKECRFDNLEIREFYRNNGIRKFDNEFIQLVNKYDLLVIGGGNFFELCWDYSSTGTTIDIMLDDLDKIKIPILINGIGVDDNKGTNENNINKFKHFLKYILNKENIIMSVRNDGSMKILSKYYNDLPLDKIYIIPDCGFFFKPVSSVRKSEICRYKRNIGINIAGDMVNKRFKSYEGSEEFIYQFAKVLNDLLSNNDDINIVFYPHVYIDLNIISRVIEKIDEKYRRKSISVAPLLNGLLDGGNYIFDSYKKCDLILSMRFHSNVCSIGQCIPNIGLITYPKHGDLFEELKIEDRMVDVANNIYNKVFWEELKLKIDDSLENLNQIKDRYYRLNLELNEISDSFYRDINLWLKNYK